MQEKYDGKRILIRITNNQVVASNRKGLSVGIPSELEQELSKLEDCVLDGELIGSNYYVFDLLEVKEEDWKAQYCNDHIFLMNSTSVERLQPWRNRHF
mgnify:CR=1 FL=1